jgi:hypothetical protein
MLAQATGELQFAIPLWGDVLLFLVGAAYLVLGSRWPRLFDVLSLTVLGCLGALVTAVWSPLPQAAVVVLGGLVLGLLGAIFRRVSHAVLAAVAMAVILATGAALIVGQNGFALYMVVEQQDAGRPLMVNWPSLACDAVLASALAGLLGGAAMAIWRMDASERFITAAQGSALIILAVTGGLARVSPAAAYPLTLAVLWAAVAAAGMVIQHRLSRQIAPENSRLPA